MTVNSGGVVFFALFKPVSDDCKLRECAAVIKFSSSRMATQSERLGYEFAKWLGVRIPQVVFELHLIMLLTVGICFMYMFFVCSRPELFIIQVQSGFG